MQSDLFELSLQGIHTFAEKHTIQYDKCHPALIQG